MRLKNFFPLRRAEGVSLSLIITFTIISFLSPWRTIELAGMAVFGWLMAVLMLLSPAIALLIFMRERH